MARPAAVFMPCGHFSQATNPDGTPRCTICGERAAIAQMKAQTATVSRPGFISPATAAPVAAVAALGTDRPMIRTYDFEQRSEEWYDVRRGIVTASMIGSLITTKTMQPSDNDTSRSLTRLLVAERITGWTEETYTSNDMLRGIMDEPLARDLYSRTYAEVTEVGFITWESSGLTIGYSPDGLVSDEGLIEVKSRRPKEHLATILADEVPTANMAQIQTGLLCSGRAWADYVSYAGGMPMWSKRVYPDPAWFAAIIAAVRTFEANAAEMVATYTERTSGLPATERNTYNMEMSVN